MNCIYKRIFLQDSDRRMRRRKKFSPWMIPSRLITWFFYERIQCLRGIWCALHEEMDEIKNPIVFFAFLSSRVASWVLHLILRSYTLYERYYINILHWIVCKCLHLLKAGYQRGRAGGKRGQNLRQDKIVAQTLLQQTNKLKLFIERALSRKRLPAESLKNFLANTENTSP